MTTRHLSAFGTSGLLHVSMAVCLVWTVAASVSRSPGASLDHAIRVFTAAPDENPAFPGLNPDAAPNDAMIRPDTGAPALSVPGFTFDVRKISDHPALLFPFLSPGLRLEYFGLSSRRATGAEPWQATTAAPGRAARDRKPPLALSDAALQTLLDASWSRRDRWTAFQHVAILADRYSATGGKLPVVLHAYLAQDGLQPYVDGSIPDPRLWAELGIAADHVRFIGFISRYAAAHPGTEATTELLLLLDACAQANLDALIAVRDTDLRGLEWTRRTNRGAYDLMSDVQRYYRGLLARQHLFSRPEIVAYYDQLRLGILNGILRTTPNGYRASDARYLIGVIDWREGRTAEAIRMWRALTPEATDGYAAAAADILAVLREPTGVRQRTDIERALDREHGRWVSRSFDRLRTFGFRFDTF